MRPFPGRMSNRSSSRRQRYQRATSRSSMWHFRSVVHLESHLNPNMPCSSSEARVAQSKPTLSL
uniref:Uncharacterized protein n=1 Tax=Physcomitrium patens TaxID=3218 RepID=A0A2K1JV66_PHYPA|nr:hypothetical protein PHYPA_015182 [Physcomitrium patens]